MSSTEIRPDWDHYFMEIAQVVSKRSTCLRRSVGAVIVKNKQILATGYNGTPKGMPHCGEVGCLREQLHVPSGKNHELCRGIHAEQNAVVQAAVHGVSVEGGTLYCTNQPCVVCTKILINAGIERIVYKDPYPDKLAEDMLAGSGIRVEVLERKQRPARNEAPLIRCCKLPEEKTGRMILILFAERPRSVGCIF